MAGTVAHRMQQNSFRRKFEDYIRKRTVLPILQTIQTLRFVLFHRAAQFVRPGGALRLRLTDSAAALHPDPRCTTEGRLSSCHIRANSH